MCPAHTSRLSHEDSSQSWDPFRDVNRRTDVGCIQNWKTTKTPRYHMLSWAWYVIISWLLVFSWWLPWSLDDYKRDDKSWWENTSNSWFIITKLGFFPSFFHGKNCRWQPQPSSQDTVPWSGVSIIEAWRKAQGECRRGTNDVSSQSSQPQHLYNGLVSHNNY